MNDKTSDLERMFRLFNRVEGGLVPMASIVQQFIESVGNSVIEKKIAKVQAHEAEGQKVREPRGERRAERGDPDDEQSDEDKDWYRGHHS